MPRDFFAAPWSTLLKVVTLAATLLLVGVGFMFSFFPPVPDAWVRIAVASLMFLLPLACALSTIRGYQLKGRTLLVRRLFWNTTISLEGLREAKVDPEAMRKALRLCGNGGLFSFTGWYRNKRIGTFRAYVTDLHRTVVLTFADRKIVISPDKPTNFVEAISRSSTRR